MLHVSTTVNSNNNLNSLNEDEDIDSFFIELPEFVEESISGGKVGLVIRLPILTGVCHSGAVVTKQLVSLSSQG